MDIFVTDKMVLKGMRGAYSGWLVMAAISEVIVVFCAIFCGVSLGWTNILSLILLVVTALLAVCLLVLIVKMASVRKHRIFQRYGSAGEIADRINEGVRNPRYLLMCNNPFGIAITDDFIVSGFLGDYLEISDICDVQPVIFREVRTVVLSMNPIVALAGTAMINYGQDRARQASGVTGDNRMGRLIVHDIDGRRTEYPVRQIDLNAVIGFLKERNPRISVQAQSSI